jgi:hypothetical protein
VGDKQVTPEKVAKNLCSHIPKPGLIHLDWLEEQVCIIIRDAYERAATIAAESNAYEAAEIAADIRALKGPAT